MTNYTQTLEQYIDSGDFKSGVISATKAGWGGSGYSIELFEDGTWRNLWNGQIGNLYETSGIILNLPQISENETSDLNEEVVGNDDTDMLLGEAFDNEAYELAQDLRLRLRDQLATLEL